MAVKTLQYFKDLFQTGYVITEDDYADWLDSFRHVSVPVPLGDTSGLSAILDAYRRKSDKVNVSDLVGLTDFLNSYTANFLTSSSMIDMSQISGLTAALSDFVDAATVAFMISEALDGVQPSIGSNGNWIIGGTDTGQKAVADSWTIGANGNWWVNGVDSGNSALPKYPKILYDYQISGLRGVVDAEFTMPSSFIDATFKLWKGGQIMQKGNNADYVVMNATTIKLFGVVSPSELLMAEYMEP